MKNLIILISILPFFNVNAQRYSPEELFTYVEFFPAIEYIENHTLEQIDTTTFKKSLITISKGFLDKEGIDQFNKVDSDLVLNPINLEQTDFNKKVANGFLLLNIKLNDTISFENLNVKYAEAKWLQAINETEKAERIYSFIQGLEIQDDKFFRFIHASRLRLAQIKFKKGLKNEALELLYKVNDKELVMFTPDLNYDSRFNYKKGKVIAPSKRLINYIKKR